jgi:hypothetical protein
MTAPDRGTIKPESSCIEGAVHTWLDEGRLPSYMRASPKARR